MTTGRRRIGQAVAGGAREVFGLLVDDGAATVGIVLAVVVAALLAGPLGGGDAVGWALFALVWAALALSLRRARRRRCNRSTMRLPG